MSPRSLLARGALALALAFAGRIPARGDDPSTPGGEPRGDSAPVELPEEVVRTPAAERTSDPTAAVTVVSAERYAGEAKAVAELVATAPGVAVGDYGGLGPYATASIRGSSADQVLVLLDGLPLNSAFGGGVDLSTIPRQWISRLEIVRGTEGAHYGAGALGGAVDVVTRGAEAGSWNAETSGGSFGTWSAAGDVAAAAGPFTVLAGASADVTDGRFPYDYDATASTPGDGVELVRTHNGAARAAGLVKLGGPLAGGRLDALAQVSGGSRDVPPPPNTPGDDEQQDGRAVAMVRLSVPGPVPGLSLSGRAQLRLDRLDLRLRDEPIRQRGAAAGLVLEASQSHRGGELRGGASIEGEALDATGLGGAQTRSSVAAWLSEDVAILRGALRLAPAVRVERLGPFAGWSAKLGATARLAPALLARASAGRTFRAPSFAELYLRQGLVAPNPDLRPEDGLSADAGLAVEGRAGMASVGAYATLYRDLILYDFVSMGRMAPRNAGRAVVGGVEAEAATAPAPALAGLALSGAYTLLLSENLRDDPQSVGRWLPHRARHRLYARVAAAPGPVSLHVEAQYVGRQYLDSRNVLPVPAALLWNAGAALRLPTRPALALALEVKNALDQRDLEDSLGNPLPGRIVLLTLRSGSTPTEGTP